MRGFGAYDGGVERGKGWAVGSEGCGWRGGKEGLDRLLWEDIFVRGGNRDF